jgi:hypothetical protein
LRNSRPSPSRFPPRFDVAALGLAPASVAPFFLTLAALVALAPLIRGPFAAPEAHACSICGCDPSVGSLGLDRPSRSALRLSVEDRYLAKEAGTGDDAEGEKEDRLAVRAQWAPLLPLVLQVDVPFFVFKNHYSSTGAEDFSTSGLGDVAASARWEFFRSGGVRPLHVLALTGTLKLPTGANDLAIAGQDPDEHIQRGTGTVDGTFGLHFNTGEQPWAFFASVSARVNGTNSRGFRYGDALFGSAGARRTFFDDRTLLVSLEAQARFAAQDQAADPANPGHTLADPDSGGSLGYGTASVAWAFQPDFLLRATLQVPVVKALYGTQAEHPVAYLSLAYDFEL